MRRDSISLRPPDRRDHSRCPAGVLFPRTARAHSVVPALPAASPTPCRVVDAPMLGARQRETDLRENCRARDGFKGAYSEKQARYETDATLWHTRMRCGDWYKQWGSEHCRMQDQAKASWPTFHRFGVI